MICRLQMKSKIINPGNRNYRIDIPAIIRLGMKWQDNNIELIPKPEENELIIKNLDTKPVSVTEFFLNINEARWIKNKKKYRRDLRRNMSRDGRQILNDHDIWIKECEDKIASYKNILKTLEEYKDNKKFLNSQIKEIKSVIKESEKYKETEIKRKRLDLDNESVITSPTGMMQMEIVKESKEMEDGMLNKKRFIKEKLTEEGRDELKQDLKKMKDKREHFEKDIIALKEGLEHANNLIKNAEKVLETGEILRELPKEKGV